MTRYLKTRLDKLEAYSPPEIAFILADRPVDDDAVLLELIATARKHRGVAYITSPAVTERDWLAMVGV